MTSCKTSHGWRWLCGNFHQFIIINRWKMNWFVTWIWLRFYNKGTIWRWPFHPNTQKVKGAGMIWYHHQGIPLKIMQPARFPARHLAQRFDFNPQKVEKKRLILKQKKISYKINTLKNFFFCIFIPFLHEFFGAPFEMGWLSNYTSSFELCLKDVCLALVIHSSLSRELPKLFMFCRS